MNISAYKYEMKQKRIRYVRSNKYLTMLKAGCYITGFIIALWIVSLIYGCKKSDVTPQPQQTVAPPVVTDTVYLRVPAYEWYAGYPIPPNTYNINSITGISAFNLTFISATIVDSVNNVNYGTSWTYIVGSNKYFTMTVDQQGNEISMHLITYMVLYPEMGNLGVSLKLVGHPN